MSRNPITILTGLFCFVLSESLGIRFGLSASAVAVPIKIALLSERSWLTSARDSSPVIHFELPSTAAVRPSSVVAIFQMKYGRLVFTLCSQARLL